MSLATRAIAPEPEAEITTSGLVASSKQSGTAARCRQIV
jgi:hypothetical protein